MTQDSAATPIARMYGVVLDCSDVEVLARFYRELLGYVTAHAEDDWISLVDPADRSRRLSMQQASGHRAPTWPGGDAPQQLHLDLLVDDLAEADGRAQSLGATAIADIVTDEYERFRVYRDPAGHPFCLIEQLAHPD